MVTISTTERVQRIFIPLPGPVPADGVAVRLENTTDHTAVLLTINEWAVEGFLLRLVVCLPETGFFPGEWRYALVFWTADGEHIIAEGLVDAREESPAEPVQYEEETSFKQYGE